MTQAQATSSHARGWERAIAQVNEATDQTAFLSGMLQLQCMIVAADYGAIWILDQSNTPHLAQTWPTQLEQHGPDSSVIQMLKEAAQNALKRGGSQILKLHIGDTPSATDPPKSLVFTTLMRARGRVAAISTTVAESRDTNTAKATIPMRELAAGLVEGFEAKKQATAHKADAQSVRLAMALLAVSQEGRGFQGACLNLVNELARQQACTRVSLGWVKGQSVRVVAMSDTEHLKRHDEQVALIELTMSECLDQQQPIVHPVSEQTEPMLAHAVVHAHRRLTGDHPNKHALSIPLRHDDEWLGAITLERADQPFDEPIIQRLQLVTDVIAPHLEDRKTSDRFLVTHAWHSVTRGVGYLVGPKHVGWKMLGLLIAAALLFAIFGTWPYYVTAPFTLEALDKRIVPAPYAGRLDQVMVEPGRVASRGQTLAQLDATELKLQLAEASSQLRRAQLERAQATAEGELAEAQQARAQIQETQARIDLLQHHIQHATIRSPVHGYILSGYWHDKVGGVVEQGQDMFEVAPIQELVVLVRVSEEDIDFIDPDLTQVGELATRSVPEQKFNLRVMRVVPLASPVEGANVFEVRCHIDDPADWLRPGMEGLARINIGPRRIIWIATHRIINTVRLWLWL